MISTKKISIVIAILICIVTIIYSRFAPQPHLTQVIKGSTMGTFYTIKYKSISKNNELEELVKVRLSDINKQMSVFDTQSDINKINNTKADEAIILTPDMFHILKTSHEVYTMSNGAFDPTVGKLVDLWGFGASKEQPTPTQEQIDETLKHVGFDKIDFSNDMTVIKKQDTKTYLNLSAIAKGYGVDEIANVVLEQGIENFVVEIGGEVKAYGENSYESGGWNIGVANPLDSSNAYTIKLHNASAATSGDYRNFKIIDGKQYAHTISSKTGYPVANNISSVTVVDESCMKADALATAITAMTQEEAIEFINNYNLSVIMFIKNADGSMENYISDKARALLGMPNDEPNNP